MRRLESSRRSFLMTLITLPVAGGTLGALARKLAPRIEAKPKFDPYDSGYSFSNFIVGRHNEFAHAACFSVANDPGNKVNNPLFICSPTGMGKTHLMRAVGRHIEEQRPNLRVKYTSGEKFFNECIRGIRKNEMANFRKSYREDCDVLLVDDVQILGRGEATQEEFLYTMEYFQEHGKLLVITSDRFPKEIPGLWERIRSRMEYGLIADVQMPDLEVRRAVLKYKAERAGVRISDDVLNYVSSRSRRSFRELEGNLHRLKMYSELHGRPINLGMARRLIPRPSNEGTFS